MKLWEAMLEGAKKGPQLFGVSLLPSGESCAFGAIYLGAGINPHRERLQDHFPELDRETICPEADHRNTLSGVIVHLNDEHNWSRQRIAEWLANRELKFKPMETKVEVMVS